MPKPRPYSLSIAGFDPSAGAGILADIKTFEQLGVYGLGVCTALTVQNEDRFERVEWTEEALIFEQLEILFRKYEIACCKIGIVESWGLMQRLVDYLLEKNSSLKIIVDPVLRASTGFDFHSTGIGIAGVDWMTKIYLITPNKEELFRFYPSQEVSLIKKAWWLAHSCHTLFKGGHVEEHKATDHLFLHEFLPKGRFKTIRENPICFSPSRVVIHEKHGSGCVLSSAITAYLARGEELETACRKAKDYITEFLDSNSSLLGYHKL